MDPHSWTYEANCRGLDTEMFFPKAGGRLITEVVNICSNCPVRLECLNAAMAEEADDLHYYGIRGGLAANHRRELHRAVRRSA